jgi:hypothetical protein
VFLTLTTSEQVYNVRNVEPKQGCSLAPVLTSNAIEERYMADSPNTTPMSEIPRQAAGPLDMIDDAGRRLAASDISQFDVLKAWMIRDLNVAALTCDLFTMKGDRQ